MLLKKPLLIQNINPRTIITILIWLIVAWVLARPLQGIGQNIYLILGSFTNQVYEVISKTKLTAQELIRAKELSNEQSNLISLLKIKINYLENEIKESENLKKLLNLKKSLRYRTLCASIIGRSADNWHKQITINRGKNSNIMLGDSVISTKGIVGQIVEVEKTTSQVQLISDPAYKLGCKITRKSILGILSGKTNAIGLLEFIPIGTDVMIGDFVVTSGIKAVELPPTYPPNHPIGKISKVSKKKSKGSDLYIEVKLFENLNSLSNVLVFSPN